MKKAQPHQIERVGLSIEEITKATGLGRSSIYKEIAAGRLKTYKVGRRRLASPEALKQWAQAAESRAA
jgi:excisionase family DNA binding protein